MNILKYKIIFLIVAFIALSVLFFYNIIQSIKNNNQAVKQKNFKITKKIKRQIIVQTIAYLLTILTGVTLIL